MISFLFLVEVQHAQITFSAHHSTDWTLPTMSKFCLTKISSLHLGAGFGIRNLCFARPKPRKDLPAARFYPYTSTKFCGLMYNYSRKLNDGPEYPLMMGLKFHIAGIRLTEFSTFTKTA